MNENIKEAFPSLSADMATRAAIASRAASLHQRHRQVQRIRRTMVGGLVTTTLILAGVMVGPSAYAIYRLNQIAGTLEDCQTMIREDFAVDDQGNETRTGRTVYAEGKWRIEKPGRIQIYRDGTLWSHDARLGQVLKFDKPDGPFGYNASGASIRSMMRDLTAWNWGVTPTLGRAVLDGRPVTTVTLEEGDTKTVVYADLKTALPILFRGYSHDEQGRWKLRGLSRPLFNRKIDLASFKVDFPASAKVVDVSQIKRQWAAKVEKPLATLRFSKGEIAIRDYAVNERGHIFIIYSNGETAADREAYSRGVRNREFPGQRGLGVDFEVTDSLGNEYLRSEFSFQPYMSGYGGKQSEWIELNDGQVLHGAWLIPVTDRPWSPRRLQVRLVSNKEFKSWPIEVQAPTTKLIAEWFYALAIAPKDAKELKQYETLTRISHFNQVGDHQALIPLVHLEIARLDEFGREHRRRVSKMDLYWMLYGAHNALGEREVALRWLKKASQEPEEHNNGLNFMIDMRTIRQTMEREGLK